MSNVVIYQAEDGHAKLEVQLDQETVWLNLNQMAELFDRDKSVISRHLNTIFKSGELSREATVAKNATVQTEGGRDVMRSIDYFNLDVIISVGYRVNSKSGIQFRQWATQILREHLVNGYTLNQKRLEEQAEKLTEMRQAVELLSRTLEQQQLVIALGKDVLHVITDYAYALSTLDRYDHGSLAIEETSGSAKYILDYATANDIVQSMKGDFAGLFGLEKDQGFKSALGTIYQTFDGKELYPSAEEKAANLLYFIVKNHAFSDGNKRIAAAIFIYFLARNGILYRADGSKRLGDNALVALTLLIAASKAEEKDTIVKVIVNLINRSND
ncbi:MAG: virulence protein RhuM/Fic/DOC family protein [Desulfuromonas sp.]